MPIHDQGYRRYAGSRSPGGRAWSVIATAGLRTFLAKRGFIALLLLAWVPFVVRTVQIYAAATLPQATFLAPTAETFRQFLAQQHVFVFFVSVYVGAGLIANDRRANALQIYLSKPLARSEYIIGKLSVLVAFLLFVTWVPAVLLLVVQIAFAGSFTFFASHLYLFPAVTVYAGLEVATVSAVMLALSSLSNSSRFVGILYAGLLFFNQAVYGVLAMVTHSTAMAWIDVEANLTQVGLVIFRLPPKYDMPWGVSLAVLLALIGGSAWVLERRVRGVEVVS